MPAEPVPRPAAAPRKRNRTLTPLQASRRARILTVAAELVTTHGYAGVTMRELAQASGVALKTLYDVYGSKDELLIASLKDRVAQVYEQGEATAGDLTGVARLLHLCESGVIATIETEILSKAVASIAVGPQDHFNLRAVAERHFRPVLEDIQRRGELAPWADAQVLSHTLRTNLTALLQLWAADQFDNDQYKVLNRLITAQTLASTLRGAAAQQISATIEAAHRELGKYFGEAAGPGPQVEAT